MAGIYDSLVGKLSPKQLSEKCSFKTQREVSKELTKWRNVGPYLFDEGWSSAEDLIDHSKNDDQGKRLLLLTHWSQTKGLDATNHALIRAFVDAERRDLAEKVCELLAPAPGV